MMVLTPVEVVYRHLDDEFWPKHMESGDLLPRNLTIKVCFETRSQDNPCFSVQIWCLIITKQHTRVLTA
jgi:hypothetical protein